MYFYHKSKYYGGVGRITGVYWEIRYFYMIKKLYDMYANILVIVFIIMVK